MSRRSKAAPFSSASQALITFGQSLRATWPLRSLSPDILAWLAMKRWASSVSDISSENRATGFPSLTATFSAMFVTSALFPIDGRAASTIRFDF